MSAKSLAIKGTIGLAGISGASVGGFYGIKALNKETKPNTVKEYLIAEGYTPFEESASDWQDKFNKFRDGDNTETLKLALQENNSNFQVVKQQENSAGGATLKAWCKDLLNKERTKLTGYKTMENAKLFCAEKKVVS